MDFKKIALLSGTALLALALYCTWLWQPARQVQRHTATFLKAVERRKWDKVATLMADDYADRWEHDKGFVLHNAPPVFRQFVTLEIQNDPSLPEEVGKEGTSYTIVRISGQGSPIAQYVTEKVNVLRSPFFFTWRRASWKPWDWQLTRLEQSELEIPDESIF
jgi:hypothetical protein